MNPVLSRNGQAILLLTAPLIAGRGASSPDLLSPGEYKRLAQRLRELRHQPADLLSPDAEPLLSHCQPVIDTLRLQRLLGRGLLLSQVLERWQARAIWVVSRADPEYPRRLKIRLREDSPAVLYGCGDMSLLETGGLAVVGSRNADSATIEYAVETGGLAARAGHTLVSGGAKGIDQAAMRGALQSGGRACGVLADSLEKSAMSRENRKLVMESRLVLVSPYDPSAGFNVGHAMQRNKLVYALADAALVVSADFNKGGTWAGAAEQLDKLKFVPVFVRSSTGASEGLDGLIRKGATPWPNPLDAATLEAVFHTPAPVAPAAHPEGRAAKSDDRADVAPEASVSTESSAGTALSPESCSVQERAAPGYVQPECLQPECPVDAARPPPTTEGTRPLESSKAPGSPQELPAPAEVVFAAVRESARRVLTTPTGDSEFASALGVSGVQAKVWLKRLLEEGVVEKQRKPPGYVLKASGLFE